MLSIAPGVWLLKGYPPFVVNVYLVEDVLIDAGTRFARPRVLRQLKQRPPRQLVLTHCHPDHQGAAAAVCQQFRVPLACHEADVPAMEGRAPMLRGPWWLRLGARLLGGPPMPVAQPLRAGDEVAGFRVIHTPGHTPGHIILFRERDRVAIGGDLLANINFRTGEYSLIEPPRLFSWDYLQNRQSFEVLAALEPSVVCFGHGPPLRDPARLARAAQKLRERTAAQLSAAAAIHGASPAARR